MSNILLTAYPLIKQTIRPLLCILFTLLLAGCSIIPSPYTSKDFKEQANQDLIDIFNNQEPIKGEIDLYEAMARAVKYNLDHQVSTMENSITSGLLAQSHDNLLPQLAASAGYKIRNNENGSSSKSLSTGIQNTETSTSSEKKTFTADIITVWNLLDFGVSLTQAHQQADEVLISEEQRRKTVQNIVQDLRLSYWQAVSAKHLIPEMDKLLTQVESALSRSRKMESRKSQAPRKILDYQQELIEIVQELWGMRRDLVLAKTELATLINLKPGSEFTLDDPGEELIIPSFALDELENNAMIHRPELRIESYQKRIGTLEVKKAMLQMLPGLELSLNSYYDKTKYLVNNNWLDAGFHLSWNVFNLVTGKTNIENAKLQESLAQKRHMSASMMVLTQVNLAYQRHSLALREYQLSSQLAEVHRRKIYHIQSAKKARTSREMDEIRDRTAALSAKMQQGVAFAELQASIGRVMHSIGNDPLPQNIPSDDLDFLARLMKHFEKKEFKRLSKNQSDHIGIQNPFSINLKKHSPNSIDDSSNEIDLIDQINTNEFKKPLSKQQQKNSAENQKIARNNNQEKRLPPTLFTRKNTTSTTKSIFVQPTSTAAGHQKLIRPKTLGQDTNTKKIDSSFPVKKEVRIISAKLYKKSFNSVNKRIILPPPDLTPAQVIDKPNFIMEKDVIIGPSNYVNIHQKTKP